MDYRVSFIIPCFNEADYLDGCLAAIAGQLGAPGTVEVLVIDNGSSDATVEVAARLGARVLVNPRRGAASSRNLGAGAAGGELLAFVDADCLLEPGWLARLAGHLDTPGVVAAAARALPLEEGMTWVERAWGRVFVRKARRVAGEVRTVTSLGASNVLLRRESFERAGGFDESLLSCEDYDLSQRLRLQGSLLMDERIRVIHLRESKTLAELFRRETSRGRFSLRCFAKNGYALREVPSIALPALVALGAVAACAALLGRQVPLAALSVALVALLPLAYLARSGPGWDGPVSAAREYLVAATYLTARAWSLLLELGDLVRRTANDGKQPVRG